MTNDIQYILNALEQQRRLLVEIRDLLAAQTNPKRPTE